MQESNISQFEDMNRLAFNEFISLLADDSATPADWKEAFKGCTINNYQSAVDYFETLFDSGENANAENKTT